MKINVQKYQKNLKHKIKIVKNLKLIQKKFNVKLVKINFILILMEYVLKEHKLLKIVIYIILMVIIVKIVKKVL